jgi:hypothetical protein
MSSSLVIIVHRSYSHGPSNASNGGGDIVVGNAIWFVAEKLVLNARRKSFTPAGVDGGGGYSNDGHLRGR